ncbi:MAG: phospholipid carrier-dependent glycosyltransferase [bacterium]|nr:phospholipid carrier-dependent glycosyltransferase [bacterium]
MYLLTAQGRLGCIDPGVRYAVTKSIVERRTFSIDPTHLLGALLGKDGRTYSFYFIGQSLVFIPPYLLARTFSDKIPVPLREQFKQSVCSFVNVFFMAASCILLLLLLVELGYEWKAATPTTLIYAFATICFPHAQSVMDPAQVIFFTILMLHSLVLYSKYRQRKWGFISGIAFGIALLTRLEVLLIIPGILIWSTLELQKLEKHEGIKWFRNGIVTFIMGVVPFIVIILWYNFVRFGSVFETGYQKVLAQQCGISINLFSSHLVFNLYRMLLNPRESFFLFSPILILFPFLIRSFIQRKKSIGVLCLVVIGCWLYFYSVQQGYRTSAEIEWGQRYLVAITPFMVLPLVELFSIWERLRRVFKVFISLLIALSVSIQLIGVSVSPMRFHLQYVIAEETNELQNLVSPIRRQWQNLWTVSRSMKIGKPWSLVLDSDVVAIEEGWTNAETIQKARSLNVVNFWWIHLYYTRLFPLKIIVTIVVFLVLIGLISCSLLVKILFSKEKLKKS